MRGLTLFILLLFTLGGVAQTPTIYYPVVKKAPTAPTGGAPPGAWSSQCSTCPNENLTAGGTTYTPTSAADMTNVANAGKTAIITNTFDVTGSTFAADQIIQPNGGALTGTNVNFNGARVIMNGLQAFNPSFRLSTPYNECLSPDMFGAAAASDDTSAIVAMWANADYGKMESATYQQTNRAIYSAGILRTFKWVGNNAVIESTFSPTGTFDFIWDTTNIRLEVCDLEVDGNSTTENFWEVNDADFYIENMFIHDFVGDSISDRPTGIEVLLSSTNQTDFRIYNSVLDHFECPDDNIIGNGNGSIRALLIRVYDSALDWANITFDIQDSQFSRNFAEGEGIHVFPQSTNVEDIPLMVNVNNCTFLENSRRDIKMQCARLTLTNSTITKIDSTSPWADNVTTSIGVALGDTPTASEFTRNNYIAGNNFGTVAGETNMQGEFISLSHSKGTIIENNTFTRPAAAYLGAISINSKAEDNIIRNNTLVNGGLMANGTSMDAGGGTSADVYQNTITYNDYQSGTRASVIGMAGTLSDWDGLFFHDNTIDIDFPDATAATVFDGVIASRATWNSITWTNVTLNNNAVTFTGPNRTGEKFLYTDADFGSTNAITNHNPVTGITATNAFTVNGTDESFTSTNNKDELGNDLTKQ